MKLVTDAYFEVSSVDLKLCVQIAVCDTRCSSGCVVQGAGKCDADCQQGYTFDPTNHKCDPGRHT